jgi:hypothetical protein
MSYLPLPTKSATAAAEITRRSLRAIWRKSAGQRAMTAVDLIEGRSRLAKPSVELAAMMTRVSPPSVRTALRASARDRLALDAGTSLRSIRRPPAKPQTPSLLDRALEEIRALWAQASLTQKAKLLRMLKDAAQTGAAPAGNGHAHHPTA